MAAAERLAAFWLSEKTKVKICVLPALALGETVSAVGTGLVFRLSVADLLTPLKLTVMVAL